MSKLSETVKENKIKGEKIMNSKYYELLKDFKLSIYNENLEKIEELSFDKLSLRNKFVKNLKLEGLQEICKKENKFYFNGIKELPNDFILLGENVDILKSLAISKLNDEIKYYRTFNIGGFNGKDYICFFNKEFKKLETYNISFYYEKRKFEQILNHKGIRRICSAGDIVIFFETTKLNDQYYLIGDRISMPPLSKSFENFRRFKRL